MEVISIYNQKGGVAKTTMTWLIGEGLTYCDKGADGVFNKVLLIDFDAQCNLTETFLNDKKSKEMRNECNILNVLKGASITENALETGYRNLFILPGSEELDDMDAATVSDLSKPLSAALQEFMKTNMVDYVIIDNNPTKNYATNATMLVSNLIIIPYVPDLYTYNRLRKTVSRMKEDYPETKYKIVTSKYKKGSTTWAYQEAAKAVFADDIAETIIPDSSDIANILQDKKSPYTIKASGKISDAYFNLIAELFGFDSEKSVINMISQKRERKAEFARKNLLKMKGA